jgi:hypothetical protein
VTAGAFTGMIGGEYLIQSWKQAELTQQPVLDHPSFSSKLGYKRTRLLSPLELSTITAIHLML